MGNRIELNVNSACFEMHFCEHGYAHGSNTSIYGCCSNYGSWGIISRGCFLAIFACGASRAQGKNLFAQAMLKGVSLDLEMHVFWGRGSCLSNVWCNLIT